MKMNERILIIMSKEKQFRQKILIVDDSEMNRLILSEMLGDDYEIVEAEDGGKAVAILQKHSAEISLVLLDVVMPVMDGYAVLAVMNTQRWIEDIPVIMISAETSPAHINRAYELGVTDFISRPYDATIVKRRVVNTILLYAKQKKLVAMVSDQIYEKEKNSNLMISILSHIVEFRNGESGLHILHVQTFTDILLRRLVQITDKYYLSPSEITLISNASALHDIGKISIPDSILNKPGRLTKEEFEIMKTHSAVGAAMLDELPYYKDEPLVKVAYEICRWHHERYDGRGYPDGLKGDEIPISAQIVAMADVYDALTSDRVYKKAFSHEVAMDMIMNGECGTFNPVLLQCLCDCADKIRKELMHDSIMRHDEKEMKIVADEILRHEELSSSERTIRQLEHEVQKNDFFASISDSVLFEYTKMPSMVTFSDYAMKVLGVEKSVVNPAEDKKLNTIMDQKDLDRISTMIAETTPNEPTVNAQCKFHLNGEDKNVNIICRSMWSSDEIPKFTGTIGKCLGL